MPWPIRWTPHSKSSNICQINQNHCHLPNSNFNIKLCLQILCPWRSAWTLYGSHPVHGRSERILSVSHQLCLHINILFHQLSSLCSHNVSIILFVEFREAYKWSNWPTWNSIFSHPHVPVQDSTYSHQHSPFSHTENSKLFFFPKMPNSPKQHQKHNK